MNIGVQKLGFRAGRDIRVLAGNPPIWGLIGATLAWDLTAAKTDVGSMPISGVKYRAGDKIMDYGTIITRITGNGTYAGLWTPYNSINPVLQPAAPTLTDGGAGALAAGAYKVGVAFKNANGTTEMSALATITLGANKKAHVGAIVFPAGVTSADYFISKAADSVDVAFVVNRTDGTAFDINALGTGAEEPTVNTTYYPGTNVLTRGNCGILDRLVIQNDPVWGVDVTGGSDVGYLIGGPMWMERIKYGGGGQPSLSDLLAAFPQLEPAPAV